MRCLFLYLSCFISVLGTIHGVPKVKHPDNVVNLIVGGKNTDIAKVPYQAALLLDDHFFCGAAVLSENFVITGAHCILFSFKRLRSEENILVRVGSNKTQYGGQLVKMKSYKCHPEFNYDTYDYDICLLRLEKPLRFNKNVQPIKLADVEPEGGEVGLIAGWGTLSENGADAKHLQSVMVPLTNKTYCYDAYEVVSPVSERMICAGVEGKDSCQGDSGGGLSVNNQLVGIISTGFGCGVKNFPGVYISIAHPDIRKFIKKITNL